MKTLKSNTTKLGAGISSMLILFATILLLAGCQKEELTSMSPDTQALSFEKNAMNVPDLSFTVIKIDHIANHSLLPDYSVTIKSDGKVIFIGRKRTFTEGEVRFNINTETLKNLESLFLRNNFSGITDNLTSESNLPMTLTSFTLDRAVKPLTLADNSINYPAQLISLRENVENMLMISRFINGSHPDVVQYTPGND